MVQRLDLCQEQREEAIRHLELQINRGRQQAHRVNCAGQAVNVLTPPKKLNFVLPKTVQSGSPSLILT